VLNLEIGGQAVDFVEDRRQPTKLFDHFQRLATPLDATTFCRFINAERRRYRLTFATGYSSCRQSGITSQMIWNMTAISFAMNCFGRNTAGIYMPESERHLLTHFA
jgi:hypothetical protein